MFVGHYGPSFAAKAVAKSVPLWVLFLAVQLVDILWAIFVLAGIEKVGIVQGITAASPLDLTYMPFTHSLTMTAVWFAVAALVYRACRGPGGWSGAWIVGAAVASHWFLDFLVHRPDLPLYDNTMKVGLGLWNYPVVASVLEAVFLFGGLYLYYRATRPAGRGGRWGMLVFALLMAATQGIVFFGPPPTSGRAIAVTALASYLLFAAVAYGLERRRV